MTKKIFYELLDFINIKDNSILLERITKIHLDIVYILQTYHFEKQDKMYEKLIENLSEEDRNILLTVNVPVIFDLGGGDWLPNSTISAYRNLTIFAYQLYSIIEENNLKDLKIKGV